MGEVAVDLTIFQGAKEREIKEWIMMGRKTRDKIGIVGKEFDVSNMAILINYLNLIGVITDIEKIKLQSEYA